MVASNENLKKELKQIIEQNEQFASKQEDIEGTNSALQSERDQLLAEINELKDQLCLSKGGVRERSNGVTFSPIRGTSSESDVPTEDDNPVSVDMFNSHDLQVSALRLFIICCYA